MILGNNPEAALMALSIPVVSLATHRVHLLRLVGRHRRADHLVLARGLGFALFTVVGVGAGIDPIGSLLAAWTIAWTATAFAARVPTPPRATRSRVPTGVVVEAARQGVAYPVPGHAHQVLTAVVLAVLASSGRPLDAAVFGIATATVEIVLHVARSTRDVAFPWAEDPYEPETAARLAAVVGAISFAVLAIIATAGAPAIAAVFGQEFGPAAVVIGAMAPAGGCIAFALTLATHSQRSDPITEARLWATAVAVAIPVVAFVATAVTPVATGAVISAWAGGLAAFTAARTAAAHRRGSDSSTPPHAAVEQLNPSTP